MKYKRVLSTIGGFLAIEKGDLSEFLEVRKEENSLESDFEKTRNNILRDLFNLDGKETNSEDDKLDKSEQEKPTFKYILKTTDIEDYYTLLPVIRDNVIESSLHIKEDTFFLKITLSEKESILEAHHQVIGLPTQSRLLTENAYDLIN